MKRKELVKRYGLFIISLWFSALGVAVTKCGSLGVSCISSVPNVLSLRFTALTIGGWTFVWNTLLVICQIGLLRKNFQKIQLLQIPLSFLFGWFTDLAMLLAVRIPVNSYPMQLFMVVLGVAILAFGITLGVIANVCSTPERASSRPWPMCRARNSASLRCDSMWSASFCRW